MKRLLLLSCILTVVGIGIIILSFGCSIDSAGGTGVGNPSGNTTVSIVADTGLGSSDIILNQPIPIQDESLVLLATSVYIVVQKIYFILDEEEKNDSIIDSYIGPLTFQGNNAILDGPFVFNALTGTADFSFDSLMLPETKYKGIKFVIENDDSTLMEGYSVLFTGEFFFNGTLRNFAIKLSNEKDIRPYLVDGPAVFISKNSSTEFRVTLNADHWLDYLDLKTDYLDDGTITLDPVTGDLLIDKTVDDKVYKDFNKVVRLNIMKSGSLEIISR